MWNQMAEVIKYFFGANYKMCEVSDALVQAPGKLKRRKY